MTDRLRQIAQADFDNHAEAAKRLEELASGLTGELVGGNRAIAERAKQCCRGVARRRLLETQHD